MTLPGLIWHGAATLAAPPLRLNLLLRARRGKEVRARLAERRGFGAARPPGRLAWIHAASVGETVSALPVIEALAARDPALHILVTTGTVTSAETLARRIPAALAPRILHRFVPLDVPGWTARFLDGWRPDAGAFLESEIWPNLLAAAAARGIPLALVNARISPRSFAAWRRAPALAREALGRFRLILARGAGDAERLRALGAAAVEQWGDLKAAAPPLPVDPAALAALRAAIGARPVLLGASTHPGEEAQILAAHAALAPRLPGLLTILVPRHPDRGPAVAAAAAAAGLPATRRAAGEAPGGAVHVADTLGELGLFYRAAGVAVMGGTLVPKGGQNPLEPARLGCPILLGPHVFNFEDAAGRLLEGGGALAVPAGDPGALAEAAGRVLSDGDLARRLAGAAAGVAEGGSGLPGRVADALIGLMPAVPTQGGLMPVEPS